MSLGVPNVTTGSIPRDLFLQRCASVARTAKHKPRQAGCSKTSTGSEYHSAANVVKNPSHKIVKTCREDGTLTKTNPNTNARLAPINTIIGELSVRKLMVVLASRLLK